MDAIAPLLTWIESHPHWAGIFIFLVAFSESLAVVGLFMPGAALMFGIGALVGTGSLALWPTLSWAAAGAIAGDGVSFWLGRHFHGQLRSVWPFRSHPELIDNATRFFRRHGGKSVLLGRFVGPIRPIIPAVAGMMDMPAARFLSINVLSGILWAPAYVIPGMVFATTLGLAAEIATRLAILVALLIAVLLAVYWLVKHAFRWLHPKAHSMITSALDWSRLHPVAGQLPAALLDPNHPEGKALTVLALLLLIATAAFAAALEAVGDGGLLANLNTYIFHNLQALRTPAADRLMVAITELGDGRVLAVLFVAVLAWLLVRRNVSAAAHWGAAAAFSILATYGLKALTAVERPTDIYTGVIAYAFPSGHAVQTTILVGFLSVLCGRELSDRRRWLAYAGAALLIVPVAFSRLYLGAHWLTDVVGGLALGLAWVALLGIAYRRHPAGRLAPGPLCALAAITLAGAGAWNISQHYRADLTRYAVRPEIRMVSAAAWQDGQWQQLPAFRAELRDIRRHPLTLQYAGGLEPLKSGLQRLDWHEPPLLTGLSWLRWLNSGAPLDAVPVLPQVHNGLNEALLLTRDGPTAQCRRLALRIWPSPIHLQPPGVPLWEGNVSCLIESSLPGVTVLRTAGEFAYPLAVLAEDLTQAGIRYRIHSRPLERGHWKGQVILAREPPLAIETDGPDGPRP